MANRDRWELYDGTSVHGPFAEDALVKTIERGMPATMKCRRVGEDRWLPIVAYEPFANALAYASTMGGGRYHAPAPSPPVIVSQVVNVHPDEGTGCAKGCAYVFICFVVIMVMTMLVRACTGHL